MKTFFFLLVLMCFIKCNSINNDNNYYPSRVNDTMFYLGDIHFKCETRQLDTTYLDTMYIIRTHDDSVVFFYRKLSFFDKTDNITQQESWEHFSINEKFEIKLDEKYFKYDIVYSFKNRDSLIYSEYELDKLVNVDKMYFFNGVQILSTR